MRISVIIPTYSRPERLVSCLAALAAQKLPHDEWEVIVVDDGSPTPVAEALSPTMPRPANLRMIRQRNRGPAAARNAGAAQAKGRLLAFLDDDCLARPHWLAQLEAAAAQHPDALLGGRIVNGLPDDPYAESTQLIVTACYHIQERDDLPRLFTTSNLALPADAFAEMGGFSERFPLAAGEDYDLCQRWNEAGRPSGYVHQAVIVHRHGLSLGRFWRQHFTYGRGLYRFRELAASRRTTPATSRKPGRFHLELIRFPLTEHRRGGLRYCGLVAAAQAATLLGAARERFTPAPAAPTPREATP